MYLTESLARLRESLPADISNFMPEVILCGGIVLLLLLRLFTRFQRAHVGALALIVAVACLVCSWVQWSESPVPAEMFGGMLAFDRFTVFLRLFLYGFASLLVWLSLITGIPDNEDSADFYALLLGATLGMSIMVSANHLLMIFIGVEMASLPSYALAGFLKGRRQSSEAALKYVVYGGGASGVMLYGISLLAGKFGTGYLPDLAKGFAAVFAAKSAVDSMLVLGMLFLLIGVGFKLAAFPFHFWCPDVFEGASAEVAGFLSVASKGAALALLGRFALTLSGLARVSPDMLTWERMAVYLGPALAVFAALTATFGNLAAYRQTNLKRLLAYSTIAHAGYMMMGLATLSAQGLSAVLFYLVAYLFMNLGAFAVVAFLRNATGSEDLSAYRGLIQRAPLMVVTLGFFLLSLLGLPPLAGFAAKFQIFRVLYDAGQMHAEKLPVLSVTMYALLVIGGLNTVLSVFYYIKVLKVMALDRPLEDLESRPVAPLAEPVSAKAYATVMAIIVLAIGILWDPIARASDQGSGGSELAAGPFQPVLSKTALLDRERKKASAQAGSGRGGFDMAAEMQKAMKTMPDVAAEMMKGKGGRGGRGGGRGARGGRGQTKGEGKAPDGR
jgi:NADH-quinone oxidoreductase subunit N